MCGINLILFPFKNKCPFRPLSSSARTHHLRWYELHENGSAWVLVLSSTSDCVISNIVRYALSGVSVQSAGCLVAVINNQRLGISGQERVWHTLKQQWLHEGSWRKFRHYEVNVFCESFCNAVKKSDNVESNDE